MERRNAVRDEPVWRRMRGPAEEEAPAPSAKDRERPLVLVVEDDRHDWEIYGKILWYNGFDVLCAADGVTGLRLARERRPDLVLLDLALPEMDGLELCRRLKQPASTPAVPVVVLSARSRARFGEEARGAGCDRYLEKPQSPLQVLHEVEKVIGPAPPGAAGPPPEMGGV